ncbi:MAG: hypothetical protein GF313_06005 [Caldithrix sp.]|nr:hypothetical protein [Caldithrix sp.]
MIKALLYKEWLKMRWGVLSMLLLFVINIVYIILQLDYTMRMYEAHQIWYNTFIRGMLFYSGTLVYLPFLSGLVIAILQFYPEVSDNRLKLTLHLPMTELGITLLMIGFGTAILILTYWVAYALLTLLTTIYFPMELIFSMWITSLPWFLGGLMVYWMVTAIFIEPAWKFRRILLIILAYFLVQPLITVYNYNAFAHSLTKFFILSLLTFPLFFISLDRFRKGVY